MKSQIFIVLISVILCSQSFLRKLDDTVTEESCKNEGKKFQAAVSASCKVSDYVFDVKNEKECVIGTWSEIDGCENALEIEKQEDCENTPTFTETGTSPESCTLNGVSITIAEMSKTKCETELDWTPAHCSDSKYTTKTDCEASKNTWTPGYCSVESLKNQTDCEASVNTWTPGYCSDSSLKNQTDCEASKNTWTPAHCTSDESKNSTDCGEDWVADKCTDDSKKNSDDCLAEKKGTWTDDKCSDDSKDNSVDCLAVKRGTWYEGSCSVSQFTTEGECSGTPTYTAAQTTGVCKLGNIVLSSRTTQATCEVELKWGKVKACSYKQLKTETACKSKPEFTEGTPAKCVESSSNFLKTATFVFFIICLLF